MAAHGDFDDLVQKLAEDGLSPNDLGFLRSRFSAEGAKRLLTAKDLRTLKAVCEEFLFASLVSPPNLDKIRESVERVSMQASGLTNKRKAEGAAEEEHAKSLKPSEKTGTNENSKVDDTLDGEDATEEIENMGTAAGGDLKDAHIGKGKGSGKSKGTAGKGLADGGKGSSSKGGKATAGSSANLSGGSADLDLQHRLEKKKGLGDDGESSPRSDGGASSNAAKNLEARKNRLNKVNTMRKAIDEEHDKMTDNRSDDSTLKQGEKSIKQEGLVSILERSNSSTYEVDPGVSTSRLRSMADAIHATERGRHRSDVAVMTVCHDVNEDDSQSTFFSKRTYLCGVVETDIVTVDREPDGSEVGFPERFRALVPFLSDEPCCDVLYKTSPCIQSRYTIRPGMAGSSLQEHRSLFAVKNSKLVTAQSKMSSDFKASIASYLNFSAARSQTVAGTGESVSQNLAQAFHRRFLEEQKASELNCSTLLTKLVMLDEMLTKFEAGIKAVMKSGAASSQLKIRLEDQENISGNGGFRKYRDPAATAARVATDPLDKPRLASGTGVTVFSGTEANLPYNLSESGVPEEVLLFIAESALDIDSVELISFCITQNRLLNFSVNLAKGMVVEDAHAKRWWPAVLDVHFPTIGTGAALHVGAMVGTLYDFLHDERAGTSTTTTTWTSWPTSTTLEEVQLEQGMSTTTTTWVSSGTSFSLLDFENITASTSSQIGLDTGMVADGVTLEERAQLLARRIADLVHRELLSALRHYGSDRARRQWSRTSQRNGMRPPWRNPSTGGEITTPTRWTFEDTWQAIRRDRGERNVVGYDRLFGRLTGRPMDWGRTTTTWPGPSSLSVVQNAEEDEQVDEELVDTMVPFPVGDVAMQLVDVQLENVEPEVQFPVGEEVVQLEDDIHTSDMNLGDDRLSPREYSSWREL
ncbi:unnamed protein product [Symbiodinium sp. CCMP2592]|nr:unnamed protein product [Symbiodinium sp. CCMP2592]